MAEIIGHVAADTKVNKTNTGWRLAAGIKGDGFLSGSYPDGITTVDSVPSTAKIKVFIRSPDRKISDGVLIADIESAVDGTWYVGNLPMGYKYDVIGRKNGFNDVIVTNISPALA